MDKNIKKILEILNNNGYQAYLIGGYVRDLLLGNKSNDIDICTNALPKDLYNMFSGSANNYGGINFSISKYNVDITTFRIDKNYINRHPSEVLYTNSLEEDVKRRDFTINTICMDKDCKVIDILNGIDDLDNRLIKMVGDIDLKLSEDPLRILRAIRFATVLDFSIDDNLMAGLKKNAHLVLTLSKTRIRNELDKILMSKNYAKGLSILKELGILELLNISYKEINYVNDLLGMWAQIKVDDMPFTNNEKRSIIKIAEVINLGKIDNYVLYNHGLYICTIAGLILNINPLDINKKYNNLPIHQTKDLNINTDDLAALSIKGPEIKKVYTKITKAILNGNLKNNKKDIIEFINNRK